MKAEEQLTSFIAISVIFFFLIELNNEKKCSISRHFLIEKNIQLKKLKPVNSWKYVLYSPLTLTKQLFPHLLVSSLAIIHFDKNR